MALISFCGLLTLQVGAAILAAVFFTLAGVMLAANVFDYHNAIEEGWFPYSLILMIIFAIGLVIAGALMFGSSYSESRPLAIMSLVLIIILICYWLILCCFSFLSNRDHVEGICIDTRCPETFWIGNLRYRRYQIPEDELEDSKDKNTGKPVTNKPTARRRRRMITSSKDAVKDRMFNSNVFVESTYREQAKKDNDKTTLSNNRSRIREVATTDGYGNRADYQRGDEIEGNGSKFVLSDRNRADSFLNERSSYHRGRRQAKEKDQEGASGTTQPPKDGKKKKNPDEDEEPSRYYFGLPMIGAIILFIINLLFLLFAALVMYSWAQELDWADYYYDDDVVVVEDY